MYAVVVEGGAQGVRLRDVPAPRPAPRDVLVRVHTSALNQADLRMAASHFVGSEARTGPAVGGLELAGEVIEVGTEASGWYVGDRVMAMSGGAWAEQAVVDHRMVMPVPRGFSWTDAGATPISFLTAHDALTQAAGLREGQTVLVQGATSAAGLGCVRVARFLGAGLVIGTTTAADKLVHLGAAGCDVAIDRRAENLVEAVERATAGRGVDVVIDVVGAGAVDENIRAAKVKGRIVCLGRLAGREASFDIDEFSRKRITMVGVTFRTRTLDERVEAVARFNQQIVPSLGTGTLRPLIDRSFALAQVGEALDHLRSSGRIGKVVLDVAVQ